MRVLGIDPGYERLGIAVIERVHKNAEELLFSDCFRTSAKLPFAERLRVLGVLIERVIHEYQPETLAYERLYFNTNQKTVMGVAEVRGVVSYVCAKAGLTVYDYAPPQIKMALSGWGRASKPQIAHMVGKLIHIPEKKRLDDEYDAIAVALTHLAHAREPS